MITSKCVCAFLFPDAVHGFLCSRGLTLFRLALVELVKEWGLKGKALKNYRSSVFVGRFN